MVKAHLKDEPSSGGGGGGGGAKYEKAVANWSPLKVSIACMAFVCGFYCCCLVCSVVV